MVVLAGGLYWLQRLRVRHREVPVVTALFWREAVEETRARELKLRFRHPFAYLFILAISAALWFAAAGLRVDSRNDRQFVLLLDGSAGMARGTRFADELLRTRERLANLPAAQRSAIFCGSMPRTLLLPGEELAWFDRRVAGLAPEHAPSSVEDQLFALAATSSVDRPTTVIVLGEAYLDHAALDLLPEHFELQTAKSGRRTEPECGITALGVTPAASFDWTTVDLLVETQGSTQRDLTVEIAGEPLRLAPEQTDDGTRRRWIYRDLPANGATIEARLSGSDALTADDRAQFVLPLRHRIRVQLDAAMPRSIATVLGADPAVELVDSTPDLRFGGIDDPAFATDDSIAGIVVSAPAKDPALADFIRRLDAIGLDATTSDFVTIETGTDRSVRVASNTLDEERGWTESRSFPLFIAAATRWLSGTLEGPRFVAAGRSIDDATARFDQSGRTLDPLGAAFTPPVAATYTSQSGYALAAALLDRDTTNDVESAFRADDPSEVQRDPLDLVHWLALLAFIALLIEWALVRRGRMP